MAKHIGSLNETELHAGVKTWCASPGDQLEVVVEGFVIDLVRANGELVEVQTGNFGNLRTKLDTLLPAHHLRVVYPVAQEKWIVKIGPDGEILSRRKSPKRGRVEEVFGQLASIPQALSHPHFCLDVLMVEAEELWHRHDKQGKRGWRRGGWIVHGRRLIDVVDCHTFATPSQLLRLLPPSLRRPFTTKELAQALGLSRRLAGQMAYCLRKTEQIHVVGKRGNGLLYC